MFVSSVFESGIVYITFLLYIFGIPVGVSVINFYFMLKYPKTEKQKKLSCVSAVVTVFVGFIDTGLLLGINDVTAENWYKQLEGFDIHTPISTDYSVTIGVFSLLAVVAYFVLYAVRIDKTPPLVSVILISLVYIGMIIAVVWTIQVSVWFDDAIGPFCMLALYPLNLILLGIGLIRRKLIEYKEFIEENGLRNEKLGKLGG